MNVELILFGNFKFLSKIILNFFFFFIFALYGTGTHTPISSAHLDITVLVKEEEMDIFYKIVDYSTCALLHFFKYSLNNKIINRYLLLETLLILHLSIRKTSIGEEGQQEVSFSQLVGNPVCHHLSI